MNENHNQQSGNLYELNDVSRIYRQGDVDIHALDRVSLTVGRGEFTAFVGPSGSGKTTLLNMLGALDKPTSGNVQFENMQLDEMGEKQLSGIRLHKMGFVFQAYNLLPVFTALENVEYILILQGEKEEGRKEKCLEILKVMGLEKEVDRFPAQMSGGQQQRVAVARAMVSNPSVILADEPTANLDSKTSNMLLDYMLMLNETYKTTFLFSTHDSRVMEKAKRTVNMLDGRVDGDGEK